MTLKTRNKLFFALLIIGISLFCVAATHLFLSFIRGNLFFPENPYRSLNFSSDNFIFKYSPLASFAGLFMFSIAVPILSGVCFRGFAKTPSLEILFFFPFIVSCITEQIRFLPSLISPNSIIPSILYFESTVVMAGRILAPMTLFFSFAFNKAENRQNAERNLLILFLVSLMGGMVIPLNTYEMTSTFMCCWGYRKVFLSLNILIFLTTSSIILIDVFIQKNSGLSKVLLGFVLLNAGYYLLQVTDCWFTFVSASVLFCAGCYKYLWSLHDLNMWR